MIPAAPGHACGEQLVERPRVSSVVAAPQYARAQVFAHHFLATLLGLRRFSQTAHLQPRFRLDGWTEGQNLHTEVRWGAADLRLIQAYATHLGVSGC